MPTSVITKDLISSHFLNISFKSTYFVLLTSNVSLVLNGRAVQSQVGVLVLHFLLHVRINAELLEVHLCSI